MSFDNLTSHWVEAAEPRETVGEKLISKEGAELWLGIYSIIRRTAYVAPGSLYEAFYSISTGAMNIF